MLHKINLFDGPHDPKPKRDYSLMVLVKTNMILNKNISMINTIKIDK